MWLRAQTVEVGSALAAVVVRDVALAHSGSCSYKASGRSWRGLTAAGSLGGSAWLADYEGSMPG